MADRQDDFWDLGKLLPKNAQRRPSAAHAAPTPLSPQKENGPRRAKPETPVSRPDRAELCQVVMTERQGAETDDSERRLSPRRETPQELLFSYEPEHSRVTRVSVFRFPSGYGFYAGFVRDAEAFFEREGEEVPFLPFFSYIPQYSQLSRAQAAYYFFWRGEVRRGHYPRTDFSYIMLYLHEIINLPDRIPPQKGLSAMLGVWLAYRGAFPRLDKYLCEWVCDYCLINRLPAPIDALEPVTESVLNTATLREFYLRNPEDGESRAEVLLLASSYNWKKSKFAAGEARALYQKHIPAAISAVLARVPMTQADEKRVTVKRDAFCGALCAAGNKRLLEVEYLPVARTHPQGYAAGDLVKYIENRIRASLGIKSRLASGSLPIAVREAADAYLCENLSSAPAEKSALPKAEKKKEPDYEKAYQAAVLPPDPQRAKALERASWATTRILTETEEPLPEAAVPPAGQPETKPKKEQPVEPAAANTAGQTGGAEENAIPRTERPDAAAVQATYLSALLTGDEDGRRAAIAAAGMPEDLLAEAINDEALSRFGDVLLAGGERYTILDDYRKEAESWTKPTRKL